MEHGAFPREDGAYCGLNCVTPKDMLKSGFLVAVNVTLFGDRVCGMIS